MEDHFRQLGNEGRVVQCIEQPEHQIIPCELHGGTVACLRIGRLERDGLSVQVADQLIEDRLEMRVSRITVRIGHACLEEHVKGMLSSDSSLIKVSPFHAQFIETPTNNRGSVNDQTCWNVTGNSRKPRTILFFRRLGLPARDMARTFCSNSSSTTRPSLCRGEGLPVLQSCHHVTIATHKIHIILLQVATGSKLAQGSVIRIRVLKGFGSEGVVGG